MMIDTEPQTIQDKWETKGPLPRRNRSVGFFCAPYHGSFLQDLRGERHLSQADLSVVLTGKSNPSYISEVEQGKVGIDRDFIEQVTALFDLYPDSRANLLIGARFLPSDQDVNQLRSDMSSALRGFNIPQYAIDFGGRFLYWNNETSELFGLSDKEAELKREQPNYLEMLFDPTWGIRKRINNWEEVARDEVESLYLTCARFDLEGYRWFELLLARLRKFEDFTKLWRKTD